MGILTDALIFDPLRGKEGGDEVLWLGPTLKAPCRIGLLDAAPAAFAISAAFKELLFDLVLLEAALSAVQL